MKPEVSESWLPPSMLSPGDLATFQHINSDHERHGQVKYPIPEGCVIRRTDEYGNPMAKPLEEIHDTDYTVKDDR